MTRRQNKNKKQRKSTKKEHIPKALREQTWIQNFGKKFEHKCYINWCNNKINVFDFHVGHDKPESKGGKLNIKNLKPICARCNHSMSNYYTIKQWNNFNSKKRKKWWQCCF